MESVIEWLREARGEIIAGLVLALLGWLYSKYRVFMKMYRLKKKELERMGSDMFKFGNTKKEIERLQEALKESEAQRQEAQSRLEATQQELQRKDEAMRESEAQRQDAQSQLETSQAELQRKDEALRQAETQRQEAQGQLEKSQAELQRKSEALSQAEAKSQEASRRIEALHQEREREKATKRLSPMSDDDFMKLCESGDARKVEEAIMNGANVNARKDNGFTALILATINLKTETVRVLLDYGAYFNAKDNDGLTALAWAEYYGYTGISKLLRSYGAIE